MTQQGVDRGELRLVAWTAAPDLAAEADAAGIDWVGCDLERHGKAARQAGWGTWLSDHQIEDLSRVAGALTDSLLFARIEPLDAGGVETLEAVLERDTKVVMAPMVEDPELVSRAIAVSAGRARFVALVETARGVDAIAEVAAVEGLDEIWIGPNDLSASLGLENRFEALVCDEIERAAAVTHAAGVDFGIGGFGPVTNAKVPVPAELVFAQLARLGATGSIVARVLIAAPGTLADKIRRSRERYAEICASPPEVLEAAKVELRRRARDLGRL
jgi:2-keto-3-deoxy-L-rhamnonate aldolase RhmA